MNEKTMNEPAKSRSAIAGSEAPQKAVSSQSVSPNPLSPELLQKMDAWWRAANYLNIGQIYLMANPLVKEPLKAEHIKPRLLGHWGTSPGLNLIYVHLNRLINKYDLDVVYMAGPGHRGPALVANVYLEGTYTEYFPNITQNEQGMLSGNSSIRTVGARSGRRVLQRGQERVRDSAVYCRGPGADHAPRLRAT